MIDILLISKFNFRFVFILIFTFFFETEIFSQNSDSKIDLENINGQIISELLLKRLNEIRLEKNLAALTEHKILSKAAQLQSQYNRKNLKISHEQNKTKLALPSDRVAYCGGMFDLVDEYNVGIEIQVKTTLSAGRKKNNPSTYGEISESIVESWLADRKMDDLLESDLFYRLGFGFSGDQINGILFASIVLASEEYEKYDGFSYHKKSYKISPYDRNLCKDFDRNFEYSSELFSDNLKIEGRKIVFRYHDLSLIESMFQTNKDAMAVDILLKDQYKCEGGNALHPSKVYDGMMLKPMNRSKLLKSNTLKEQKEFSVKLGTLPGELDTADIALSLIIIKDKCACNKIAYNNLNGENIRLLDIDLTVDTISISESVDSNSRFLQFTIPFEKNKSDYLIDDIKPFLDSIQLNRFNIKEILVKAYSSIEGNPISNEELQQKRAKGILSAIKEYQLQEVQTKIESQENWDGFFESIKGSPYARDYLNKDHNTIRGIVNSDTLKYNLEPYLAPQRKAEIRIFVESIYIDSLNPENLQKKFLNAIEEKDHIRAKALQTLLYRAVEEGQLNKTVLFEGEIPQFKENIPLLNNRLAFKLQYDEGMHSDSLIDALKMNVEAYLGIDPGNGHLNFNKQAIKLYFWSKDLNSLIIDEVNKIDQPKDFYKDIVKLYSSKIDNYFVNRLLLNYNIIAADFYYERQDYPSRVKALKQVFKYVRKANLDRDQTLIMAKYFIFQMQIDWAIQIMHPFIKEGDYNSEFLLTFISIAVYDEKHVPKELQHNYIKVASEKYRSDFCKMFQKPDMSVEYFSDLRVKSIYCDNCR